MQKLAAYIFLLLFLLLSEKLYAQFDAQGYPEVNDAYNELTISTRPPNQSYFFDTIFFEPQEEIEYNPYHEKYPP